MRRNNDQQSKHVHWRDLVLGEIRSATSTPGVGAGVRIGVRVLIQNVRANVKVLEFQSFCIFCCF